MRVLLSYKPNLSRISDELGTVLQWAVIHQDLPCVNLLISANISVSSTSPNMPPAFILALDSAN